MQEFDLNLLTPLDALLQEQSVVGAARKLGLSASAMSRTLARLRAAATGDPLLVRAGRGLVPTPHALALREHVRELAHQARAVLRPASEAFDPATLNRVFTVRANEGFVEVFAMRLVRAVLAQAPGVRLRFAPKPDKDVKPLREGLIDIEIGVPGPAGPELYSQLLFQDRFVGVVRQGHPLTSGSITPARFAACDHVATSRRGHMHGPVDEALAQLGLSRRVVVVVPGFPAAVAIARASDLVAILPSSFAAPAEPQRGSADHQGLHIFPLPVQTPDIAIAQMWHPRLDADPANRWLRGLVRDACKAARPATPAVV